MGVFWISFTCLFFGGRDRFSQAVATPVTVDDIAINIAHAKTIRHSRSSLQTANQGDNIHMAGGPSFFCVFATLEPFVRLAV